MTNEQRWEPTREEQNRIRRAGDDVHTHLMIPVVRLREEENFRQPLDPIEVWRVIIGVEDLVLGNILGALSTFEQRLLDTAPEHGRIWHGCVLLWSGLCRLYACDPEAALGHVSAAEEGKLDKGIPEIRLLKGMALRLTGHLEDAMKIFKPLSYSESDLFPSDRRQAAAWLLESAILAGVEHATPEEIRFLERKNRTLHHGNMGIVLAALYRLSATEHTPGIQAPEKILDALDNLPIYQRPVLTMLLQDILPRPLKGVQAATCSPESYWA